MQVQGTNVTEFALPKCLTYTGKTLLTRQI